MTAATSGRFGGIWDTALEHLLYEISASGALLRLPRCRHRGLLGAPTPARPPPPEPPQHRGAAAALCCPAVHRPSARPSPRRRAAGAGFAAASRAASTRTVTRTTAREA